jgi:preprotein translocase subunit SecD
MRRNYWRWLIPILVLAALAGWLVWPDNPGIHVGGIDRDIKLVRGLDLQGGLQVLLEADLPAETAVTTDQMQTARDIVENRVNALGVVEPLVQVAGSRRIVVELPGINNPEEAVATIQETGLLEFIDMSTISDSAAYALVRQTVQTDFGQASAPSAAPTSEAAVATPEGGTPTAEAGVPTPTPVATEGSASPVFHTVMTGAGLKSAGATVSQTTGEYEVAFVLTDEGKQTFADYTSAHVGQILGIVLDKTLISAPRISVAITEGQGVITGNFNRDSANGLAVQLRYGSLPIPLKVVESSTVGPTLGEDSLRKSAVAGVIGLAVVMIFMATYYRLPGVLADLALLMYATVTLALFKLIPVTLTLPGVAGFVLSIGVAVDANVLIFERMKEELRAGRTVYQAIDAGFSRAWPSIRDSNLSTLITCAILFWFGSTFGASIVKGFSLTLALGVLVSLFTAITVTRTFLHVVLDGIRAPESPRLFGA